MVMDFFSPHDGGHRGQSDLVHSGLGLLPNRIHPPILQFFLLQSALTAGLGAGRRALTLMHGLRLFAIERHLLI